MRPSKILLATILLLPIAARSAPIDLQLSGKQFEVREGEVEVSGRWQRDRMLDVPLLPNTNQATISCSKARMECIEAKAILLTEADDPMADPPALLSTLETFKVESWTATKIQARSEARAATVTLLIDLAGESATRQYQERADLSSNEPLKVSWQLQ